MTDFGLGDKITEESTIMDRALRWHGIHESLGPVEHVPALQFTLDDAQAAADSWNFNCGPAAICAILSQTPDEIRPHLLDFESKGYTNPTLMQNILSRLNVHWEMRYRCKSDVSIPPATAPGEPWPVYGLVRIQWAGPWTEPGVPVKARYRKTHWIGIRYCRGRGREVFDVNAMCAGGWILFNEWKDELVPWLLKQVEPKATGVWWPTYSLDVRMPE